MKETLSRIVDWWSISRVAMLFLIIGLASAVYGFRELHPDSFLLRDFLNDFYVSFAFQFMGIGFTVLILDKLYKRHDDQRTLQQLITLVAGGDEGTAHDAVEQLRARGWLGGTKLHGAHLAGCRLAGVDLGGAGLAGANLRGSDLRGASAQGVDLTSANLRTADLSGADLTRARLDGAGLTGTRLSGANLRGATGLSDAVLARVAGLVDAVMPDGSRYDGRLALPADLGLAEEMGFRTADPTAMARFYEVPLRDYEAGQAAASPVAAGG